MSHKQDSDGEITNMKVTENRLKYKEYAPHIEIGFWYELESKKLHEWRLEEPVVPLTLFSTINSASSATPANTVSIRRESLGNDITSVATILREKSTSSNRTTTTTTTTNIDDGTTLNETSVSISTLVKGEMQNFNTVEQLRHLPRRETLWRVLREKLLLPLVPDSTKKDENNNNNNQDTINTIVEKAWEEMNFAIALLFTYADLKSHKFHYLMAFPVLAINSPIYVKHRVKGGYKAISTNHGISYFPSQTVLNSIHVHLLERLQRYPERGPNPFIAIFDTKKDDHESKEVTFLPFTPISIKRMGETHSVIVISDTSTREEFPGWSARNVIGILRLACPSITSFVLYCIRHNDVEQSVVFDCSCDPLNYTLAEASALVNTEETEEVIPVKAVGWVERKGFSSYMHSVDLSAAMAPERLAESSARLNLSLMKWRMLPSLQLDGLTHCKALVLGCGTLGCNVARNLLMWGVTNITLVDRGNVSYSNPVRQTLFEMSDVINPCVEERNKAVAAAKALKRILPTIKVEAVPMTIHMPGHRIDKEREADAIKDIEKLDKLIQEHDVVFLLTDSREARWLPTVISAAYDKPLLNAALGFDTYVVMRHGVKPQYDSNTTTSNNNNNNTRLGCYFCSDVFAPRDSMTARTLDQQCTVTRPGVSGIASSTVVELLAQLYNHPLGFACPPYTENTTDKEKTKSSNELESRETEKITDKSVGVLGAIPHQIRGSLFGHYVYTLYGYQYNLCTACSDSIVSAYKTDGSSFILRCVNDPLYIEEVSGVKAFKEKCDIEDCGGWDIDSNDD